MKNFIPVEVKLKSKIRREDMKWIEFFLRKYGEKLSVKKACIITKDLGGRERNIHFIPLWQFCFEGLSFQ